MAEPTYREGQTATAKDGRKVVFQGGQWHLVTGQAAHAPPKLDKNDSQFLNDLSTQANAANETQKLYERAQSSVKRLQPGPWRGAMLDAAIPTEGGGVMDRIGSVLIGAPLRALGAVTRDNVDDYQRLKGLQAGNVLTRQLEQKGPQTESDAARLQLTEISPNKSEEANQDVINSGVDKTNRARARAVFYTQWANKYGLHGQNERGRTADQVWAGWQDDIVRRVFPNTGASSPVRIKRIR